MSLIQCHECQKEISSDAATCPNCGAKPKQEGMPGWAYAIVAIIVLILLISALGHSKQDDDPKDRARQTIALCWQNYEKKSLSEPEKRFIASTCEMQEKKFEAEYNQKP